MNGANLLFKKLTKFNIRHVFGYSGGANLPLLNSFHNQEKIKFIKSSNELCSGFSAIGYTKALNNNKPGVIISTSGPGVTNLITPLQDAFNDGIPLIAITCQVNSKAIGTDAFQECNAIGLTNACTKANYQIKNVDELESTLIQFYNLAMMPRKGPVHIDIPKDVLTDYVEDKDYIDNIKEMFDKSERPILLVGQGCNHLGYKLTHLVDRHLIPITTTLHAMGVVDECHRLSLEMLGMHGSAAANYLIQDADLVIGLGVRFDDRITGKLSEFAPKARIVHVDNSYKQSEKVKKLFHKENRQITSKVMDLELFIDELSVLTPKLRFKWLTKINEYKNKYPFKYNKTNKLKTQQVIEMINTKVNKYKTIFTTGVGNHQMMSAQFIKWRYPNRILTSGSLGTMGVGVPYAIGAYLSTKKDIIVIDGDSSFNMTSNDLQTILENNIPIKIFIMNDSRQQMVYVWQELFFDKQFVATDNKNPDYVKLANSYNIKAIECSKQKDLESTVQYMLDCKKAIVGNFIVEPDICLPLVKPGKALDDMLLDSNYKGKDTDVPN